MDLGLHYTLDDANSKLDPEVLAIAQAVTPQQSPAFGKVWDLFGQRANDITTDKFQVMTRGYTQPTISITAGGSGTDWDSASATTGLPVSSTTIDRITVGDALLVEDEIVVVKTIDRSANTIAVYERGAGETSGARHGTGALTVKVIGNAAIEGHVDVEAMAEATGILDNYMQLVEEKIDLTFEDAEQSRKIGRTEPVLKQEAMNRVMAKLAKTAIYSVAVEGSKVLPAMTRGFLQWLQLTGGLKTAVNGTFTETTLKNALNDIYKAGGRANAIVMSVAKKATFNGFTAADVLNQDVAARTTGRVVDAYLADGFGLIPVVVDLDFPDDKVVITNSAKLSKGWKLSDPLRFVDEPPVNSRQRAQTLQGKVGTAVEGIGTDHEVLYGLT
jgi:hypothetical protein